MVGNPFLTFAISDCDLFDTFCLTVDTYCGSFGAFLAFFSVAYLGSFGISKLVPTFLRAGLASRTGWKANVHYTELSRCNTLPLFFLLKTGAPQHVP